MRPAFLVLTFATLTMVWFSTPAIAQDSKIARGTLTAISGWSVTVRVGDQNMIFGVDSKTVVQSRGASSASLRAAAAGRPGPQLDELLQMGQAVAVTYAEMAGSLHAIEIRSVSKPDTNAGSAAAMTSAGVVQAIGPNSITIAGESGGRAPFEQTFQIDQGTRFFAKGASAAVAAKGGRAPFTDLIAKGDYVTVSYQKAGNVPHASDVRVTKKVTH